MIFGDVLELRTEYVLCTYWVRTQDQPVQRTEKPAKGPKTCVQEYVLNAYFGGIWGVLDDLVSNPT